MKLGKLTKDFSPVVLAAILLMLPVVMTPVPATAAMMNYTYTSNDFTDYQGTIPSPPRWFESHP